MKPDLDQRGPGGPRGPQGPGGPGWSGLEHVGILWPVGGVREERPSEDGWTGLTRHGLGFWGGLKTSVLQVLQSGGVNETRAWFWGFEAGCVALVPAAMTVDLVEREDVDQMKEILMKEIS